MSFIRYMPSHLGINLLQGLIPSKLPSKLYSQQSEPQKSQKSYDGPFYLPPQIYKLFSQDAINSFEGLQNTEAINRFH